MNESNEPKIKIGFSHTDEFGNTYSAESYIQTFDDLGYDTLDAIGEKLNAFLSQIGYVRKNGCILMEDITSEEMEQLTDYLYELRNSKENENAEESEND